MKPVMVVMIMMVVMLVAAMAVSSGRAMAENAEMIDIQTGGKGLVPFPHGEHQDLLKNCMVCHQWFPQQKEGILKLKGEGRLGKMQIMKDLCIQCHKDTRKAGKESGPESCSQCHSKG
jgi:hypothetical protein